MSDGRKGHETVFRGETSISQISGEGSRSKKNKGILVP